MKTLRGSSHQQLKEVQLELAGVYLEDTQTGTVFNETVRQHVTIQARQTMPCNQDCTFFWTTN